MIKVRSLPYNLINCIPPGYAQLGREITRFTMFRIFDKISAKRENENYNFSEEEISTTLRSRNILRENIMRSRRKCFFFPHRTTDLILYIRTYLLYVNPNTYRRVYMPYRVCIYVCLRRTTEWVLLIHLVHHTVSRLRGWMRSLKPRYPQFCECRPGVGGWVGGHDRCRES